MDVDACLVDQWVQAGAAQLDRHLRRQLDATDHNKQVSLSFLYLCVRGLLHLSPDDALACITDGRNDRDVDAVHIGEPDDMEFTVTLFQSKYSRNLDGRGTFPENAIKGLIDTVGGLFDPKKELGDLNPRASAAIAEVRSLIIDGYVPNVHVVACSNGQAWNTQAQTRIDNSGFGRQVSWQYYNHQDLVAHRRSAKKLNASIVFSGNALVEEQNYSRVFVGKLPISALAQLVQEHGEHLLERNIRRYLGLRGNRVNENISTTLKTQPESFYLFNNGLTMTCDKFSHNALQGSDYAVRIENLSIVNGGQTSVTAARTWAEMSDEERAQADKASVLVRLYELSGDADELALGITYATNSQNPVDLYDLKANDVVQQRLELGCEALGYTYLRKRAERPSDDDVLTNDFVLRAVLAVWRSQPHRVMHGWRVQHSSAYDQVFTDDLSAAQAVVASVLMRAAGSRNKDRGTEAPDHLPFSSAFVAMLMGQYVVSELGIPLDALTHENFPDAMKLIDERGTELHDKAVSAVSTALTQLYGGRDVSARQLASTFRRGDLFDFLPIAP